MKADEEGRVKIAKRIHPAIDAMPKVPKPSGRAVSRFLEETISEGRTSTATATMEDLFTMPADKLIDQLKPGQAETLSCTNLLIADANTENEVKDFLMKDSKGKPKDLFVVFENSNKTTLDVAELKKARVSSKDMLINTPHVQGILSNDDLFKLVDKVFRIQPKATGSGGGEVIVVQA